MVHKIREKGRVVKVKTRVVFGTVMAVMAAPAASSGKQRSSTPPLSNGTTAGTDRNRNGRKVRKTLLFLQKIGTFIEAVTYFHHV